MYRLMGKYDAARGHLERAIQVDGSDRVARVEYADLLEEQGDIGETTGDYKQMLRYANEILAIEPKNPQARLFRAMGLMGAGNNQEARSELTRLLREYPQAFAEALSQLRLVGVNGPYSILLGADAYTELAETSDHGYPVLEHVKRLVEGKIIWAPAIEGAFVVTTRGRTRR